jgi:molybdopterin molybdotransferase
MHSVEQAIQQILASVTLMAAETVSLGDAFGRFVAEPFHSPINLPPFNNSAMDGYAVRSADLEKATAEAPIALKLIGTAPAGAVFDAVAEPGTCVRIFTGSVLPRGADAVVMQEDVRLNIDLSHILFFEKTPPWENTRISGEDIKSGSIIVDRGVRLTAPHLSFLAAAGIAMIRVACQPVAAFLATGDELREPGASLPPSAIYESNRVGLAALAKSAGAIPRIYPIIPDDLRATKSVLERALTECDIVITTGGVSVGEMDWVKAAFAELGGELDFWKVAMRPGKPFAFGKWKNKVLFGLPGNPASAMVTFLILTRPALLRMQGASEIKSRTIPSILAEPLQNPGDRRHFMRVRLDESGHAHSAGNQSSHILSTLAGSTGLIDVPPQTNLPAGVLVSIMPWD